MTLQTTDGLSVSRISENASRVELIDAEELAARWRVPKSWIRAHTRQCTRKDQRIPCVRLGRYVRFIARMEGRLKE